MHSVARLTHYLLLVAGFCFSTCSVALETATLQLNGTQAFRSAASDGAKENGYVQNAGLENHPAKTSPDSASKPHIADVYADAGMPSRNDAQDDIFNNRPAEDNVWIYRSMTITVLLLGLISTAAIFIYRINRKQRLSFKELERIHQRDKTRNHVLELLAKGAPLKEILDAIARSVEVEDERALCSILTLGKNGRHLHVGAAPSLPDFYSTAINGLEIGLNVGSCGTTAYTGKRTIVENILTHPS